MAENQELIKRDMGQILQMCSAYDMRNKAVVHKVEEYLMAKKSLRTSVGAAYLARLKELEEDDDGVSDKICLFCRMTASTDGILCLKCMKKYSGGKLRFAFEKSAEEQLARKRKTAPANPSESMGMTGASGAPERTGAPKAMKMTGTPETAGMSGAYDAAGMQQRAAEMAGGTYDAASQLLGQAGSTASDLLGQAGSTASQLLGQAGSRVSSMAQAAGEAMKNASESDDPWRETMALGRNAAKEGISKAVDTFAQKVNVMAGGTERVELKFKDLFTDVLKKHTDQEAEEIFICGTSMTTPAPEDISKEWPKPWLYTRVALSFLLVYAILMTAYNFFKNTNLIPGIIFIGSFMIPVSLLVFFFEVNAPRNISIFYVIRLFFVGGAASLLMTLLLFELFPTDMSVIGACLVGIIEETGKLLIVAWLIKRIRGRRYILNGMLIGAAVGGGFAAFESAGYALRYFIMGTLARGVNGYEKMLEVIANRAILAPGGHIAWAAISGVALILALGEEPFSWKVLKKPKFLSMFAIPVVMHAVWDMPINILSIGPFAIQHILLIVMVWIVLLVLLHRGLDEI